MLQLSPNAAILTGKILPGLVGKAEVSRSLQHPEVRTRRICKFDQDIRHVEELKERNTELVGCSKLRENQGELGGSQLNKVKELPLCRACCSQAARGAKSPVSKRMVIRCGCWGEIDYGAQLPRVQMQTKLRLCGYRPRSGGCAGRLLRLSLD